MSWPFSTPASGPTSLAHGNVPADEAVLTAAIVWIIGMHFINTHPTESRTVTVRNGADTLIWKETIPPNSGSVPYSPTFEPSTGVKWEAEGDGTEVVGHVWVY